MRPARLRDGPSKVILRVLLFPIAFACFLYKALGWYISLYLTVGVALGLLLTLKLGPLGFALFLAAWLVCDRLFSPHGITRNFPVVGWGRFFFELIGPELRQYIVAANNEEQPFTRDERTWVYASAKGQNNLSSFGTDDQIDKPGRITILHSQAPHPGIVKGETGGAPLYNIPCAKVLGGHRRRRKAFRPDIFIVSAMSYGALGKAAVAALNRGCRLAGALHNTGEGGVSPYHLGEQPFGENEEGANLIWQIGTGYFGCRDSEGNFDFEKFLEVVEANPSIRAIEIKLSQGAKPGKGGILPAEKITEEISRIRGVPMGVDCISPNHHTAFDADDIDSLIDFIEKLAEATGLPVGIKSAVGQLEWWERLAKRMAEDTSRGPDYIQIDGGEGGTGAAPFVTADHVGLPFKRAFTRVYKIFAKHDIHETVVWVGSAKLGKPSAAFLAFSLGCDMIAAARQPMFSIGCIQAQKCGGGHCPAGVTTHNEWLMKGFQHDDKGARSANYIVTFRKEFLMITHGAGATHPAEISPDWVEFEADGFDARTATEVFAYQPGWGKPAAEDIIAVVKLMGSPIPDPGDVAQRARQLEMAIEMQKQHDQSHPAGP